MLDSDDIDIDDHFGADNKEIVLYNHKPSHTVTYLKKINKKQSNNDKHLKTNYLDWDKSRIVNTNDPITMQTIFENGTFIHDPSELFPIFRNDKIYLYILDSLNTHIKYSKKDIFTNTVFTKNELNNITKQYKITYRNNKCTSNNEKVNDIEAKHLKKISTLKKLDYIGTYFPISEYNKIESRSFRLIYNELKNMWCAFKTDNEFDEVHFFGDRIEWSFVPDKHEELLLDKINSLLSDNLDENIKIMISYVIIGAFAYVCPFIKKHYTNIDFE